MGSVSPSPMSVLVTEKLGTWGRKSYGLGGTGRSAMAAPSVSGGRRRPCDPRPRWATVQRSTSQFLQPALQERPVGRVGGEEQRVPVVRGRAGPVAAAPPQV